MAEKFSFNRFMQTISKLISEGDVVEKKTKANPQQTSHQTEIANSNFVLAAAVIRCDRNYTAATEKYIRDFMAKHFNMRADVEPVSRHIETGTEPYLKIACKELKMLTTYDSRQHIIRFLFGVAAADDFINAKESRCIQRIAQYLGVSASDFTDVKDSCTRANSPYKILGIDDKATLTEVKAAYRKLILKFHPDKQGGKEEKESQRKFIEIQKAYDTISAQLKKD